MTELPPIGHNNPPKPKRRRQTKDSAHYVNNKEFTHALNEYAITCRDSLEKGEERPVMSRYLGDCLIKMATRLSLSPNFRGYHYREEMVQDAILGAVKYMHRFDGSRFNNGFAYVTQILFSHMIQTIKKEKRKYEVNLKMIQNAELETMNHPEFAVADNEKARSIADQKLGELEDQKVEKKKRGGNYGFKLKSGYTKEDREKYSGTPLDQEDPSDGKKKK